MGGFFVTKTPFSGYLYMKVVLSTDSTHTLSLIPRYYPSLAVVVELKNEVTKTKTEVANTYSISDGEMSIVFDFSFADKDRYQLKLTEGSSVVYRGKIICTDQTVQDFKLTNEIYTYE